MSIMLRRKHSKARRNVASFGLAIGSRHKIIECYKGIVIKYLNLIFDHTNHLGANQVQQEEQIFKSIIAEMYSLLNSQQAKMLIPNELSFINRQVSADHGVMVTEQSGKYGDSSQQGLLQYQGRLLYPVISIKAKPPES